MLSESSVYENRVHMKGSINIATPTNAVVNIVVPARQSQSRKYFSIHKSSLKPMSPLHTAITQQTVQADALKGYEVCFNKISSLHHSRIPSPTSPVPKICSPTFPTHIGSPSDSNVRNVSSRRHPRTPIPPPYVDRSIVPQAEVSSDHAPSTSSTGSESPTPPYTHSMKTTSSGSFNEIVPPSINIDTKSLEAKTPPLDLSKVTALPVLNMEEVASTAINPTHTDENICDTHLPHCITAFQRNYHTARHVARPHPTRIYIKRLHRDGTSDE